MRQNRDETWQGLGARGFDAFQRVRVIRSWNSPIQHILEMKI
jgi:hypothetical protein